MRAVAFSIALAWISVMLLGISAQKIMVDEAAAATAVPSVFISKFG